MEKQTGTVKFFNNAKGFGFIINDSTKSEVFVHTTGVTGDIRENDKVEFDVQDGNRGKSAVNVRKID